MDPFADGWELCYRTENFQNPKQVVLVELCGKGKWLSGAVFPKLRPARRAVFQLLLPRLLFV